QRQYAAYEHHAGVGGESDRLIERHVARPALDQRQESAERGVAEQRREQREQRREEQSLQRRRLRSRASSGRIRTSSAPRPQVRRSVLAHGLSKQFSSGASPPGPPFQSIFPSPSSSRPLSQAGSSTVQEGSLQPGSSGKSASPSPSSSRPLSQATAGLRSLVSAAFAQPGSARSTSPSPSLSIPSAQAPGGV